MQKNCGIGGQALIEGIMMRNKGQYAMAARRPDGEIEVSVKPFKSVFPYAWIGKTPVVRGAAAFIDSLAAGLSSLMWSADIAAQEEEEDGKEKSDEELKKEQKSFGILMTATMIVSLGFSILLFMLLPFWAAGLLARAGVSALWISLAEAVLRIVIFLLYMLLISRIKDIERTFAYHGAEHKCINCIESGKELTVENVMASSREHRRCGTSFLLIVILLSVIAFLFLGLFGLHTVWMKVLVRLLLIPVIAGVSYELLRYAGSHEGPVVDRLVRPGLALQRLVTREPDEEMCLVAIAAVNAVFDWKEYQGR